MRNERIPDGAGRVKIRMSGQPGGNRGGGQRRGFMADVVPIRVSVYATAHCPRCGSLVHVKKLSARRRSASCSFVACDTTGWEWTEPGKYAETLPKTLILGSEFRRIAEAQRAWARRLAKKTATYDGKAGAGTT